MANEYIITKCCCGGCTCPPACSDCSACGVSSVTFSGFSGSCICCDFLNDTWTLSDVCTSDGDVICHWENMTYNIDESDATTTTFGSVLIDVYCDVGYWNIDVAVNLGCAEYDGSDLIDSCIWLDSYSVTPVCADSSTQCPNKDGLTFEFPAGNESIASDMCSDLSQDADTNPRTAVVS